MTSAIVTWIGVWVIGVLISLAYYRYFLKHSYWYEVNYLLPGRSEKWLHRWCALSWLMFAWMMYIMEREDRIEDLEEI